MEIMRLKFFIRALRAAFLPAALLPFASGALRAAVSGYAFNFPVFFSGFFAVASAHLAGNLLNDYYDYISGADNINPAANPFFGGSKMIQNNIFTPLKIKYMGVFFFSAAFFLGLVLFFITGHRLIILFFGAGALLTHQYTAPPLKLAYRMLGEVAIFFLFGIIPVYFGFYILTGVIDSGLFPLGLLWSFLILCVIVSNEIPDADYDLTAGKKNLISIPGKARGYILYLVSFAGAVLSFLYFVSRELPAAAPSAAAGLFAPGAAALIILKYRFNDVKFLTFSSALTILMHFLVGAYIIIKMLLQG